MTSSAQASEAQFFSFLFFLIFIAFILFISSIRVVRGSKYSEKSVMNRPIFYLIYSIIFSLASLPDFLSLILIPFDIVAGYLAGRKYGVNVSFFIKDDYLYYKGSIFIYVLWLSFFIIRVLVEIFYPNNFYAIFIVNNLLLFSTGLLLGEARHIISIANKIRKKQNKQDILK